MRYLLQKRESALWFLTCLFVLEIVMYFVCKIKQEYIRVLIVMAVTVCGLLYERYINIPLIWNIDIAMTTLAFFYIGYIFRKKNLVNKCFQLKGGWPWLFFAFGGLNLIGAVINNKISGNGLELMNSQYGFWPLTYMVAVAGILAVLILANRYTNKFILYLGRNSLIYFGLHQAVVMWILDKLYKVELDANSNVANVLIRAVITFSIIIISLTIVSLIINNSPLKFFLGKREKSNER